MHCTEDKVLLKNPWKAKFIQDANVAPYTATEVQNIGLIYAHKGNIVSTNTLCGIIPFGVNFHYGSVG